MYLPCSRALRTSYPTCSFTSCALCLLTWRTPVSHVDCTLHVLVPNVPPVISVLVPHVPRALRAFCPMCPHALSALFTFVPLAPHTFHTLYLNITFRALESPCLTLLFFCSFTTFDIFGRIY